MSADKTTKTDVIPAPLENSHAGLLLSKSAAPLALSSGFSEFDDAFGEALQNSQTAKAFAAALYEAKVMAGAIYIKNAIGPAAKDHQNQPELGKFWSTFADWCIDRTLRFVWQMPTISRHFASPIEAGDTLPGFFVLGLGKLGGQDLNYSSDVDLVAFFEIEDFKVRENAGRTDVAVRALKALTQILTGSHGPRIWRVDWRLRPDPSVTGLAMSAEAGLDFFFFHAAPWRRLAMMKARACAGDVKVLILSDQKKHLLRLSRISMSNSALEAFAK